MTVQQLSVEQVDPTTLAAALLAGTLAAWRATRLPPAQALTALD
jgi:ABC-type lipoprotein release transport system permease subunit